MMFIHLQSPHLSVLVSVLREVATIVMNAFTFMEHAICHLSNGDSLPITLVRRLQLVAIERTLPTHAFLKALEKER